MASTQCGTDCGADDTYRVRGYETTLRSPRFNNAGSQITVLVLQNAGTQTITGTFTLWPVSGSVAGAVAQAFTLGPHASQAFNTSVQPPGGAGQERLGHGGARRGLRRAGRQDGRAGAFDRLQLRRALEPAPALIEPRRATLRARSC